MATASLDVTEQAEILRPTSEEEAIEAFGDGTDVVVIGGGTIVVPEMSYRRLRPTRALLLKDAGLAGATREGSRVTLGAMTSIQELVDKPAPLGPCATNIADIEIRGAATVGGNICAQSFEAPRGDLQSALLALDATVRSAGEGGISEEPLEDFFAKRGDRLVLSVSFDEPAAGAFAGLDRPHTHDYTALAVSGARAADGTIRLAATGAGPHGLRLRSAEGGNADGALDDVSPTDDALASAWYRTRVLPVLVRRVLADLEGGA